MTVKPGWPSIPHLLRMASKLKEVKPYFTKTSIAQKLLVNRVGLKTFCKYLVSLTGNLES